MELTPGDVVAARYEIVRPIGDTRPARAYVAQDRSLDRLVTLTVVTVDPRDEAAMARFRDDVSALARAEHPNVAHVHDEGMLDSAAFMVSDRIDAETLSAIIRRRAPIPPDEAVGYAIGALEGLDAVHRAGATRVAFATDDTYVTPQGIVLGASLVADRGAPLGETGVTTSVGSALYEMLTARPPSGRPPAPPSSLVPGIPKALDAVVTAAVEGRYASVRALADDLRGSLRSVEATRVVAPPPPAPPPRRTWPIVVAVIAILLVVGGALAAYFLTRGSDTVSVPNVAGQTSTQASATMRNADLVPVGKATASADVAKGDVVSTNPAAGTKVDKGSTVTLLISGGPATATVPNVVGQTVSAARSNLTKAGFAVTTSQRASDSVPANDVISQDPTAGTKLAPGSSVSLVVSSGKAKATVPSVVGQTLNNATNTLRAAGLGVGAVQQPPPPAATGTGTTTAPAATPVVVSQNPAAGASVNQGTDVDLVLGTR